MENQSNSMFASDSEIELLLERFATCEIQPTEMSHRKHIALTVWCFLKLEPEEAAERVYTDLRRYVDRYHITIYNETITLFWTRLLASYVAAADRSRPAIRIVNEAIERFGDSKIIFEYYTRERLYSDEARRVWLEPDLRPL